MNTISSNEKNDKAGNSLINAVICPKDAESLKPGTVPAEETWNGQGWPMGMINSPTIQRQGDYSHFYGQLIAKVAACLKDRNILLDASCVMRELLA